MENEAPDTGPESRTLASLKKKKEELGRLRRDYYAKIKGLERDMAALDAAMRVFDPRTATGRAAKDKSRAHIAGRYILDCLREAKGPLAAADITKGWIESKGLEPDAGNRQIYGQRISNALSNMKRKGIVETEYEPGSRPLWRLTDKA